RKFGRSGERDYHRWSLVDPDVGVRCTTLHCVRGPAGVDADSSREARFAQRLPTTSVGNSDLGVSRVFVSGKFHQQRNLRSRFIPLVLGGPGIVTRCCSQQSHFEGGFDRALTRSKFAAVDFSLNSNGGVTYWPCLSRKIHLAAESPLLLDANAYIIRQRLRK